MTRMVVRLVLLVVCSCATPPPTALKIRADDQATACRVAESFALVPRIKETLDSRRDEPIDVWVLSTARTPEGYFGRHNGLLGRIELGQDALVNPILCMAHELSHWFAQESPYANVPRFVGEGLADWVACEVTGNHALCNGEHAGSMDITVLTSDLLANNEDWERILLSHRDRIVGAYRLGYEVVHQLGLSRIKAMAAANAGALEYVEEALHVPVVGQREIAVQVRGPRANQMRMTFTGADGTVISSKVTIESDGSFSGEFPPGAVAFEAEIVDRSKEEEEE